MINHVSMCTLWGEEFTSVVNEPFDTIMMT